LTHYRKLAAAVLVAATGYGACAASPLQTVPALPAPLQTAPALPATTAPVVRWSGSDAAALLAELARRQGEGLAATPPARMAALQAALDQHAPTLDALADAAALALAHDYFEGAAPASARAGWDIKGDRIDYRAWLDAALVRHDIVASLRALLPQSAAYAGLRDALPHCDTPAHCTTIRVNLERWRWLPRALGTHYLWVNPAAYRLDLVEGTAIVSTHKVIVGKPAGQTPTFATMVTGVTANPWWNVPSNIVAESVGSLVRKRPAEAARRGYVATRGPGGRLAVRQKPGPQNALGLVKLEMPNPYSVFIHDTPSRSLFDQEKRAFSHGCIRTQNPIDLAKILLPAASIPEFDALLASGTNKTLRLESGVPAYIVYFTAEPDATAEGGIRYYDDLYRRDARIAATIDQ